MAKEKVEILPRSLRYGILVDPPLGREMYVEQTDSFPVVDGSDVLFQKHQTVKVKAKDYYSKFRPEDFKITALQESGVSLSLINLHYGDLYTADLLTARLKDLESKDAYIRSAIEEKRMLHNLNNTDVEPQNNE